MKIALDVMGFENEINQAVLAARNFIKKYKDVKIIFVGNRDEINPLLKSNDEFEILNAQQVVLMNDLPMQALRKKDSSMLKAFELVRDKKADGILSAGSTSCFVPMAYTVLGMINKINKISFMPFLPTIDKKGFNMLDVGANLVVSGRDLYQYALMANIYCKIVRKIQSPRIAVLNIGTEQHKGFEYHKVASELLKKDSTLNYLGFVEPRGLLNGGYDIIITDGFSGNITLKALEGSLKTISLILKKEYKKPYNWFAAILSLPILKSISKTFDYKNNAGAIVLGVNGVAIKTHGSADQKQFYSSLKMLYDTVNCNIIEKIKDEFNK